MDDYNEYSGQRESAQTTGTGAAATMAKDKISETVSSVKEKVSEVSRAAGHKIELARESAAGVLDQTALSVLSGSEKISGTANSVAENLGATAAYVRRADLKAVGEDIVDLVKLYPWRTVAVAAIFGFMMGRFTTGHD